MSQRSPLATCRALFAWSLVAIFYLYQLILQVVPSLFQPEMQATFHCSCEVFGSISAYCLYAYTLMPLPAGLILDRVGPRLTLTLACLSCTLSSYLLGVTDVVLIAKAARFLLGFGGAFSILGAMKVASMQFHTRHFSFMIGLAIFIGFAGAGLAQGFIGHIHRQLEAWQDVFMVLALFGTVLTGLVFCFVSNESYAQEEEKEHPSFTLWEELRTVVFNKSSWAAACYGGLMFTPILVLGDLWGPSFLVDGHGFAREAAASIVPWMLLGFALASPLIGLLAEFYSSIRLMFVTNVILLVLFYFMLHPIAIYFTSVMWTGLFFCIGFFSSGLLLTFAQVKESNPPEVAATSSGFTNTLNNFFGACIQPGVGTLMGVFSNQPILEVYNDALSLIPLCLVLSLVSLGIFFRLKSTKP